MSSPFSSALEELDGSLKNVYAHIECLGAALDVNDDRLIRSLADARQHAARLRDMLRAERPAARWGDRKALGQLIQELEVEIANRARRNQQRRDKLLVLATELEGGSIKHRFDTRAGALNALRLEAVQELRSEAAMAENVKELPGPEAHGWLRWACGLLDVKDAGMLTELRRSFPALERFAGEMEEGYWRPNPSRLDGPTREGLPADRAELASASEVHLPDWPQSLPGDGTQPTQQAQKTPAEFYTVSHTATYESSLSPSYGSGPASAVADLDSPASSETATRGTSAVTSATNDEALIETIASATHVKICDCGGTFPLQFQVCPFDGSPLRPITEPVAVVARPDKRKIVEPSHAAAGVAATSGAQVAVPSRSEEAAAPAAANAQEPAKVEFERLKNILQRNTTGDDFQLLDTGIPRRKLVMGIGAAAGVVLLTVVLGYGYRASGVSVSKLRSTVAAGMAPTVVQDSDIQREIEQKLVLLKASTVEANVEKGVVTLVGRSSSKWEALHAESLASQTNGVKRVKNEVEVEVDGDAHSTNTKKPRAKTKPEVKLNPVERAGN